MNAELDRTGALCPACGEGHLTSRVEYAPVEYNGRQGVLPLHSSVCDYCGSELAGEAESTANKRAMTAFRKSVDGLLTGQEIRAFRKEFSLSQDLAASLFGGGKVAFSRYENDDVTQSTAMDRLLRVCRRAPMALQALALEAGVELPKETQLTVKQKIMLERMDALQRNLEDLSHDAYLRAFMSATESLRQAPRVQRHCANDHDFKKFGEWADEAVVRQPGSLWPQEVAAA